MENTINTGELISDDIDGLLQKNERNSVTNKDFTKTWCDMAILALFHYSYIFTREVSVYFLPNRSYLWEK